MADAPEEPQEHTEKPPKEAEDEPKGFWTKLGVTATVCATIIGAFMPFTAWITGRNNLELERQKFSTNLALERQKFSTELDLKYVDRALDTSKDIYYRESFLNYLVDATQSKPLKKWSQDQLQAIRTIRITESQIPTFEARYKESLVSLAKERGMRSKDRAALGREHMLRDQASHALQELSEKYQNLLDAKRKAGASEDGELDIASHGSSVARLILQAAKETDPAITSALIGNTLNGEEFGVVTTSVAISGRNFGNKPGNVEILSWSDSGGPAEATVDSWSDTHIFLEMTSPMPTGVRRFAARVITSDGRKSSPKLLSWREAK